LPGGKGERGPICGGTAAGVGSQKESGSENARSGAGRDARLKSGYARGGMKKGLKQAQKEAADLTGACQGQKEGFQLPEKGLGRLISQQRGRETPQQQDGNKGIRRKWSSLRGSITFCIREGNDWKSRRTMQRVRVGAVKCWKGKDWCGGQKAYEVLKRKIRMRAQRSEGRRRHREIISGVSRLETKRAD